MSRLVIRHPIRGRDERFVDDGGVVDAGKVGGKGDEGKGGFFRGVDVEDKRKGGGEVV